MEKVSRRRLRSASVHLGALTALAVTLSGCDALDDDDDCDNRPPPTPQPRSLASAAYAPAVLDATATGGTTTALVSGGRTSGGTISGAIEVLPERGGFGSHLASCGG